MNQSNLLEVNGLKKYFTLERGWLKRRKTVVKAVDDVSFYLQKGETLSLVGESGCGKTTLSRTITQLYKPTEGKVYFQKQATTNTSKEFVELSTLSRQQLKLVRRDISIVFQDPMNSLSPRMTVGDIIREPLRIHNLDKGKQTKEDIAYLLESVGLHGDYIERYPHEFSGGQRQRIGIARALALRPSLMVLDEPVSALDVSIQAQILNLLHEIQEEFNLTFLFVAHDLSVVEHFSDRVAVMYVGRIVEMTSVEKLFHQPYHPYTEALIAAVPRPDPRNRSTRVLHSGQIPDPSNPPSGCYFHPRCQYATDLCKQHRPALTELNPGHFVACHHAEALDLKGVDTSGYDRSQGNLPATQRNVSIADCRSRQEV
jgi:peptide/nickel transport system ATP-binding protein